jgi:hypothetical protein
MRISWLMIAEKDAVFVRSSNRLAPDEGLDLNQAEAPHRA